MLRRDLLDRDTKQETQADSQGRKGGEQGGWMTRNKMLFDRGEQRHLTINEGTSYEDI